MNQLNQAEFRLLRQAIAARGNLRATLFVVGLCAWGAVLIATLIALPFPVVSVVPLALLVATFEAIRPLHFGAERIGRYVQVFYEERADPSSQLVTPAWERTAMAIGGSVPGVAGHPLFVPVFAVATFVNLLAVLLPRPIAAELGLLIVPHAAFLVWLAVADRAMRRQRDHELERYRELRDGTPTP